MYIEFYMDWAIIVCPAMLLLFESSTYTFRVSCSWFPKFHALFFKLSSRRWYSLTTRVSFDFPSLPLVPRTWPVRGTNFVFQKINDAPILLADGLTFEVITVPLTCHRFHTLHICVLILHPTIKHPHEPSGRMCNPMGRQTTHHRRPYVWDRVGDLISVLHIILLLYAPDAPPRIRQSPKYSQGPRVEFARLLSSPLQDHSSLSRLVVCLVFFLRFIFSI